ncbi:MAG TPA: hypothetical protein VFO01_11130 [Trebonia sp.]|nr:hypothetical protein [Trebonia sp.]
MNDKNGGNRGPRRAVALAVTAAAAVLATACGGSASSSASTPAYGQELALAKCMRGHGVPDFPDPNASGGYTLTPNGLIKGSGGSSIDINSSQAQAAYGDCRQVLPGAPSISQLVQQEQQEQRKQAQDLPQLLKWEQCVRGHGEPDFSLPLGGQSPAPGSRSGFNANSPQFQAALSACQRLLPPGAKVSVNKSTSAS